MPWQTSITEGCEDDIPFWWFFMLSRTRKRESSMTANGCLEAGERGRVRVAILRDGSSGQLDLKATRYTWGEN
jgi:hypothetical protein